jgi:hypothetical protein
VPNLAYRELNANAYTGDSTSVANPLATGTTPGEAYLPHVNPTTIDPTGKCVIVHATSGGTIGYRALDDQTGATDANVNAWGNQIQADATAGSLPQQVADTAGDLYSMFFRGWSAGGQGSLFTHAAPIWQELHLEFCANGTVVSQQATVDTDDTPIYGLVYQSYMPDLYLYYDGKMINQTGAAATSPVQIGNFSDFTVLPVTSGSGSAYGVCNIPNEGNAGNPWGVGVPVPGVSENFVPRSVTFCDDGTAYTDPGSP